MTAPLFSDLDQLHLSDVRHRIDQFKPWRGSDGFLHYPERLTDGGMFCHCGAQFDCDPRHAPLDQQWPRLWVGWNKFLDHIAGKGYILPHV